MQRQDIREGTTVQSKDGEKLGKIVACGADSFIIEKGIFFPKDYEARYDDILDLEGDVLVLAISRDELRRADGELASMGTGDVGGAGRRDIDAGQDRTRAATGQHDLTAGGEGIGETLESGTGRRMTSEDEVVPVVEERLEADKKMREAGSVSVKKNVVTENKTMNVPVSREVVNVEKVEARGDAPAGTAFEEKDISIPVHEEEIEVTKRPVVKEEVRVSKGIEQHDEAVSGTVRKEKVDVNTEGDTQRSDRPTKQS